MASVTPVKGVYEQLPNRLAAVQAAVLLWPNDVAQLVSNRVREVPEGPL
jgi:hypothetical protein